MLQGSKLNFDSDDKAVQEETITRPLVKHMYNIFHPNDPVAFRIEPLFDPRYKGIPAYPIQYTKGGITQTLAGISTLKNKVVEKTQNIMTGLVNSTTDMVFSAAISSWFHGPISPKDFEIQRAPSLVSPATSIPVDWQPDVFNPNFRLDFMLHGDIIDNPYLSALSAHTYWDEQDTSIFILNQLYDPKNIHSFQNK